jgi:NCS1 family nucleobase:cation symporter-1
MITAGLSWWQVSDRLTPLKVMRANAQAFLCVIIGYSLVGPMLALNARPGAVFGIIFPAVNRTTFGVFGSLWPVFNRK